MSTTSPVFALPAPELTDGANIENAVVPLRDRLEAVLQQLGGVPLGGILPYAFATDPPAIGSVEFLLADGRLIDRTVYASFFAGAGHIYNGGVDPGGGMVRIPDKRGRTLMAADSFATSVGAAGRLTTLNTRGTGGGAESVSLSGAQVGPHAHSGSTAVENQSLDHWHDVAVFPPAVDAGFGWSSASARVNDGVQVEVPTTYPNSPAMRNLTGTYFVHPGSMSQHNHNVTTNTGNGVTGAPHANLPPYQCDFAIVRVR
jgi:hypothetical protein